MSIAFSLQFLNSKSYDIFHLNIRKYNTYIHILTSMSLSHIEGISWLPRTIFGISKKLMLLYMGHMCIKLLFNVCKCLHMLHRCKIGLFILICLYQIYSYPCTVTVARDSAVAVYHQGIIHRMSCFQPHPVNGMIVQALFPYETYFIFEGWYSIL